MLFLESDKNNEKIDIVILTETWHNALNHCNYSISGYKLFFSTIKRNQNDGINIFVKNTFNVDFYEYDFVETNIVKISLMNLSLPINILCIYRSPSTDISSFIETLSKIIKEHKYNGGYTVLIGDMNINIVGINPINNEY